MSFQFLGPLIDKLFGILGWWFFRNIRQRRHIATSLYREIESVADCFSNNNIAFSFASLLRYWADDGLLSYQQSVNEFFMVWQKRLSISTLAISSTHFRECLQELDTVLRSQERILHLWKRVPVQHQPSPSDFGDYDSLRSRYNNFVAAYEKLIRDANRLDPTIRIQAFERLAQLSPALHLLPS